ARERVDSSLVSRPREHFRGYRGDVARVDEWDPAFLRRRAQDTVPGDRPPLIEQVLHEMVRAQYRPRDARLLQLALDVEMPQADHRLRVIGRAECGELHDVLDACLRGGADGVLLQPHHVLAVVRQQEQLLGSREGFGQRPAISQIHLDPQYGIRRISPGRTARNCADPLASLDEQPHELASDRTRRSSDNNHSNRPGGPTARTLQGNPTRNVRSPAGTPYKYGGELFARQVDDLGPIGGTRYGRDAIVAPRGRLVGLAGTYDLLVLRREGEAKTTGLCRCPGIACIVTAVVLNGLDAVRSSGL